MDEVVGRVTIVAKHNDNLSCRAEWKNSVDVAIGDTVEVRGLRSVVRSRDDYGTSGIWFDLPVNARVKRGDEVRVSTPDFASMSADNLSLEEVQALRDWLDERGRRKVAGLVNEGGAWWICALWARDTSGLKIVCAEGPSEPAALLALCQKVAAEEAS